MKLKYSEIDQIIAAFVDATSDHHRDFHDNRTYGYAAGALQAQLAFVLSDLPAAKQAQTLDVLKQLTIKYSVKA